MDFLSLSLLTPHTGDKFAINDLSTAKFEVYDTLSKVFHLLLTLSSNNTTLKEFDFILKWESLSMEDKLDRYGKFSSHELNFFIFKKDKNFFDHVVLPFL